MSGVKVTQKKIAAAIGRFFSEKTGSGKEGFLLQRDDAYVHKLLSEEFVADCERHLKAYLLKEQKKPGFFAARAEKKLRLYQMYLEEIYRMSRHPLRMEHRYLEYWLMKELLGESLTQGLAEKMSEIETIVRRTALIRQGFLDGTIATLPHDYTYVCQPATCMT